MKIFNCSNVMDVEFLKYQFEDGYSGVITNHKLIIGVRHIQSLYMLVSSVVMGLVRGSVGIAVLAVNDENRQNDTYIQVHNWDRRVQGAVLSSFFFGYALTLFPVSVYLKRVPGRLLLTGILMINGILCSAMPTIINKGGWIAACNAQLFLGMAQGCYATTYEILLEKWIPPNEKKLFSAVIYGGMHLGIILAYPASGLLLTLPLGWELIYYSLAMATLAMAVVIGTLTASSPEEHQAISEKELDYILDSLSLYRKKTLITPWRNIVKSHHFWAITGAQTASNAIFVFYLVEMPTYIHNIFYMPLKDCALYSMLPFMSMWLMYLATSPTLDWISKSGFASYVFNNTLYRKCINCLGAFGIVLGLVILPSLTDVLTVTIVLSTTLGLLGFQFSGFLSNYKDMSENYCGTIMLMSTTVSSLLGATLPFISGLILGDSSTHPNRWRSLFLTLASIYALMSFVYAAFATNDRQAWDYETNKRSQGHYNYVMSENHVQLEELSNSKVHQERQEVDTAF